MASEIIATSGSKWVPPEGVKRHSGKTIPPQFDFFVPPPSEIGRVLTADSSLKISDQPMSLINRLIASVVVSGLVLVGVWIVFFLTRLFAPGLSDLFGNFGFFAFVGGTAALLFGIFAFNAFGFSPNCTYVGDRGITKISLKRSRQATPQIELLKFEDAVNLYTSQTRHYKQAVTPKYLSTTYSYSWTLPTGKSFKLEGEHYHQGNRPFDDHPWYFAKSAEFAWTNYLLPWADQYFARSGYVEFPMGGDPQAVRVGQGFLEFVLKNGSTQRANVSDMQELSLEDGLFYFIHRDTKSWSTKGRYLFRYCDMPNARLFQVCLKNLAGIDSLSEISIFK
ncbi:hypothetical protein TUMEXPCC7403_21630 [Tumidithrix helvetica PCC 7403]|uniref:hypothetical protein n=1 Tax=Tumidithrix helvetica TaxID=3457545 RepID=UPI003C8CAF59